VNVEAGGLNFADLLTARGGYAGTPKPPLTAGREFAGREAADNHAGRRVMAIRNGPLSPNEPWLIATSSGPSRNWTAEQAAAFP